MSDKTSPPPWKSSNSSSDGIGLIHDANGYLVGNTVEPETAAIIVRCVNAMPAMIEALEDAIDSFVAEGLWVDPEYTVALAAAKGINQKRS